MLRRLWLPTPCAIHFTARDSRGARRRVIETLRSKGANLGVNSGEEAMSPVSSFSNARDRSRGTESRPRSRPEVLRYSAEPLDPSSRLAVASYALMYAGRRRSSTRFRVARFSNDLLRGTSSRRAKASPAVSSPGKRSRPRLRHRDDFRPRNSSSRSTTSARE